MENRLLLFYLKFIFPPDNSLGMSFHKENRFELAEFYCTPGQFLTVNDLLNCLELFYSIWIFCVGCLAD